MHVSISVRVIYERVCAESMHREFVQKWNSYVCFSICCEQSIHVPASVVLQCEEKKNKKCSVLNHECECDGSHKNIVKTYCNSEIFKWLFVFVLVPKMYIG